MMDGPLALSEVEGATRLTVASLIGLAIGLEREWSGHASGPEARFAGLRTFMLLGMLGGLAGLLGARGEASLAAVVAAAGFALALVAYTVAARATADFDGTTEVAAALVIALGATAGMGWLMVSSAAAALVVLALSEKQRLHRLVNGIGKTELAAGLQFAVLAVVVLPLLPEGPIFGPLAVRPRSLWTVVLAFCALNFASYIARRAVGSRRGYGIAGALGGLLSSTAVTLAFARRSRRANDDAPSLARGVVAACSVLIPRILVVSAALNPRVALAALPYLAPALAAGSLIVFSRAGPGTSSDEAHPVDQSPLRLMNAVQMAVAFQVALSAIAILGPKLGEIGVYGAAVALGLTDMDALTVSMSSRASRIDAATAGRALAIGMLANTFFKAGVVLLVGAGEFRRRAAAGLAALAAMTLVAILLV
jgi:uncharacterized membrane protein (DUF4010 family)